MGLGCGTLGDPDEITSEAQAQATLQQAWDLGIRYFDTAPWYGNTLSEHRLGYFLRQQPRDAFSLSTKVGRVYFRPADLKAHEQSPWMARWRGGLPFDLRFDYGADGIQRAYEDSLMRLGLNTVDALVIHDLDPRHQQGEERVADGLAQLDSGGFRVLDELRRRGEVKAIGAGINHVGMIDRFLARFDIDYFLIAMPYTLLDQPALEGELQLCADRGVDVIIGAVFASGILATGSQADARYAYQPAPNDVLERVRRIEAVCRQYDVTLPSAALQFPLRHPCVRAVIPGANAPEQVAANVAAVKATIDPAFWAALKDQQLIHPLAP